MRLIHSLAPARFGGLERVVQSLSRAQVGAGHDVHLAVILDAGEAADHPFPDQARRGGVHVHVLPVKPRAYLRERSLIGDLYRRLRPDVAHTHGYRADVLHRGVAARSRIPCVSTVHGFTGGGARNRFYERLQCRSYRRCQAVVAVSRSVADRLAAAGVSPNRLRCVPNAWAGLGVSSAGRVAARDRFGIADRAFHIGFVGRVDRVKGADVFVDALGLLADLPFEASVMGTSPGLAAMKDRAAGLGIGDRIRWHGMVPEAGRWFSGFDVFVLSSRTEGTPMALLEAIAAGVPVVATRVGGVPDVVSEREADLVEPERPDLLAAAIRRVHSDADAAGERAARARSRLDQELSVGTWVDRYDRIYEEAVAALHADRLS